MFIYILTSVVGNLYKLKGWLKIYMNFHLCRWLVPFAPFKGQLHAYSLGEMLTFCWNISSANFWEFLGEHAVLCAGDFIKKVVCNGWSILFGTAQAWDAICLCPFLEVWPWISHFSVPTLSYLIKRVWIQSIVWICRTDISTEKCYMYQGHAW